MKYLYILEGKIGRIDRDITNANILGLCTDNITSCNIIILISADKKRYVLIHADLTVTPKMIADEINWIGVDSSRFILRREESGFIDHPSSAVKSVILAGIKDKFTEQFMDETDEVVTIKVNDLKPIISLQLPKRVEYHPQTKLLFTKHAVEAQFKLPPGENGAIDY